MDDLIEQSKIRLQHIYNSPWVPCVFSALDMKLILLVLKAFLAVQPLRSPKIHISVALQASLQSVEYGGVTPPYVFIQIFGQNPALSLKPVLYPLVCKERNDP